MIQHICFIAQTNGRGSCDNGRIIRTSRLFIELLEILMTIWSFHSVSTSNDSKWRRFFFLLSNSFVETNIHAFYQHGINKVCYHADRPLFNGYILSECRFQSEWLISNKQNDMWKMCAYLLKSRMRRRRAGVDILIRTLRSWYSENPRKQLDLMNVTNESGIDVYSAKCEWLSTFTLCVCFGIFRETTDSSKMFLKLLLR